jgi:hypothetical protein
MVQHMKKATSNKTNEGNQETSQLCGLKAVIILIFLNLCLPVKVVEREKRIKKGQDFNANFIWI